jgi:purine nucleosidase
MGGSGRLGQWLWEHFTNPPEWARIGGSWPMGDSPPVLITALTDESSGYTTEPAAPGGAERRMYTHPDFRLIVGDLLARLRLHERRRGSV